MIYARIAGTGSYLPGQPVTNADLVARGIDTSDEWVVGRTGIHARHLAEAGVNASDLAYEAALRAIDAAAVQADEIDLIIVATSTPDYIFPSTAALLQSKLGVRNNGAAFDVQAVCSGFVYALSIAEKFIRSGSHRKALVVGSEIFSGYWTGRTVVPACFSVMAPAPSCSRRRTNRACSPARCMPTAPTIPSCAFREVLPVVR